VSRRGWPGGALALGLAWAAGLAGCHREDRLSASELRREITALEQERETLYARLDDMVSRDPRLAGMPQAPLRVDIPTELLRDLLGKLAGGFANQVTLTLENLHVRHHGEVKKLVRLGTYDLEVTIAEVSGRLQTGTPQVGFGNESVSMVLPVRVDSGQGRARLHFHWNGEGVAGTACGDLDAVEDVGGRVKPADYVLAGSVRLQAAGGGILAIPRFPPLRVRLRIEPSAASWAAARRILDSKKTGFCGTVLDHVDVLGLVRDVVDQGFEVRLPTEKIHPATVPVVVAPTVDLGGRPLALAISVGELAITERSLWLGVQVQPAPPTRAADPPPAFSGEGRSLPGRRPAPAH